MIRNCLTVDSAMLFLNALIFSHLPYGLTSRSQANQSATKAIESLYNRALKIFDKKANKVPSCYVWQTLLILHYAKLVFKYLNRSSALPFYKYIKGLQSCRRSSRAASSSSCKISFCKVAFSNPR